MNQVIRSSGQKVNPAAGTVLLDTGPLLAGIWHFQFLLAPSADQVVAMEWYSEDDVTKLFDQYLYLNGDTPIVLPLVWPIQTNQRIKLVEKTASLVGNVSVGVIGTS